MTSDADEEKQMLRYLLGDLSEEDQVQIEERFLRDPEYFERLRAVEEDLNDEYARGELTARERVQFEKRMSASPEWRQRAEFAGAFSALGSPAPTAATAKVQSASESQRISLSAFLLTQSFAFKLSFAAAAIMVLLAGSWLVLETRRLRAELERLQAERQQIEQQLQNQQQLQKQITDERERAASMAQQLELERERSEQLQSGMEKPFERSVISFILMPGISRGDEQTAKFTAPSNARLARLQLYLQGPSYKSYQAELRTVEGNPIWKQDKLAERQARLGKAVELNMPANVLRAAKYELTLRGVGSDGRTEDIGYYYFSVIKGK